MKGWIVAGLELMVGNGNGDRNSQIQWDELKQEYRDGAKLGQRIQLYDLFSRNQRGWYAWVFDQFEFPSEVHILELGCGPELLWQRNAPRISAGWEITLSNISPGMLKEAQSNLQGLDKPFQFAVVEAQSLPLTDKSVDMVVANHMLYHVPDRRKAYAEIQRVLKPGGQLYAATNGQLTMRQYDELIARFSPENSQKPSPDEAEHRKRNFCLENGYIELSQWFSLVTERRYEDALVITDAAPLVAYAESSRHLSGVPLLKFRQHVEAVIGFHGSLYIDKIAGLLIATKGTP